MSALHRNGLLPDGAMCLRCGTPVELPADYCSAHKHPAAPAAVPAVTPDVGAAVNPIGATETSFVVRPTEEAGAPNLLTSMPCRECNGEGQAEYMGLCDSYYRWADCHKCFGTGREKPYCEVCNKTLTIDGFCIDCDAFAEGFAPPERIAPLPNGWSRLEL